jgi:ACT domain-containing protein
LNLSEEEIRKIAIEAISEMDDKATPEGVKEIVRRCIESISGEKITNLKGDASSGRVILTAFGLNHPGIVASVTKSLGDANCDIQDLTQKLMGDFFTMIIMIDISSSPKDLKEIQEDMKNVAEQLKIKIYLQHEDVFRFMHRI